VKTGEREKGGREKINFLSPFFLFPISLSSFYQTIALISIKKLIFVRKSAKYHSPYPILIKFTLSKNPSSN
jgi:hypothetical protein